MKKSSSSTLKSIKEESSKVRLEIDNAKKDKLKGPQRTGMRTFLKLVIWGSLIIILTVGVINIIVGNRPRIIENRVVYDISPVEGETAKAFAISFVNEFLTYDGRQDDYRKRIEPYIINSIANASKVNLTSKHMRVTGSQVWMLTKLDENHANLVVKADLEIYSENEEPKRKTVYLNVPIQHVNGQYIVDDYPTFQSGPDKPDVDYTELEGGETVDEKLKQEIKGVLQNFFETYCQANSLKIGYFLTSGNSYKGLDGVVEFKSIDSLKVYMRDVPDKVTAVCEVSVVEPETGIQFNQKYILDMLNKADENRWYIETMECRGNRITQTQEGK